MAVSDPTIDRRILVSARREFLANGFDKTSLNAICQGAGITTGALYKRYRGKEDLFCAVVAGTVSDLEAVVEERRAQDVHALTDAQLIHAWEMDEADMLWWFRFLHTRREDFVLLLTCADGTAYRNFQHDWVAKMTEATGAYLAEAQRRNLCRRDVGPEELHILLTAFWATIYEPFIHGFTWEQMEAHVRLVCRLFCWKDTLQFRMAPRP